MVKPASRRLCENSALRLLRYALHLRLAADFGVLRFRRAGARLFVNKDRSALLALVSFSGASHVTLLGLSTSALSGSAEHRRGDRAIRHFASVRVLVSLPSEFPRLATHRDSLTGNGQPGCGIFPLRPVHRTASYLMRLQISNWSARSHRARAVASS